MFPWNTYPHLKSILFDHSNDLELEPESAGIGGIGGLDMNVVGEVEAFGFRNVTL